MQKLFDLLREMNIECGYLKENENDLIFNRVKGHSMIEGKKLMKDKKTCLRRLSALLKEANKELKNIKDQCSL
jgi:hypothetical protein